VDALIATAMLFLAQAHVPTQSPWYLTLYTEENPPYSFHNPATGEIDGMVTTIVRELMQRTQTPYRMEILPWTRAYHALRNTPKSCAFMVDRTPEREPQFHWISPMVETRWHLFKRPDTSASFSQFEEASSYQIVATRGFASAQWLEGSGHQNTLLAATPSDAVKLLYRKRVDFWIAGAFEAPLIAERAGYPAPASALGLHAVTSSMACNLETPGEVIDTLQEGNEDMAEFRDAIIRNARER